MSVQEYVTDLLTEAVDRTVDALVLMHVDRSLFVFWRNAPGGPLVFDGSRSLTNFDLAHQPLRYLAELARVPEGAPADSCRVICRVRNVELLYDFDIRIAPLVAASVRENAGVQPVRASVLEALNPQVCTIAPRLDLANAPT